MKKISVFLILIIAVVSTVAYAYLNYKADYRNTQKENAKFEIKEKEQLDGTKLTTIINRAIDTNEKNKIQKGKNGKYIKNETNSINIDIKFIDDDAMHNMETIYQNGIEKFVYFYKNITFQCQKVQYHEATGKIKYLQFEQMTE